MLPPKSGQQGKPKYRLRIQPAAIVTRDVNLQARDGRRVRGRGNGRAASTGTPDAVDLKLEFALAAGGRRDSPGNARLRSGRDGEKSTRPRTDSLKHLHFLWGYFSIKSGHFPFDFNTLFRLSMTCNFTAGTHYDDRFKIHRQHLRHSPPATPSHANAYRDLDGPLHNLKNMVVLLGTVIEDTIGTSKRPGKWLHQTVGHWYQFDGLHFAARNVRDMMAENSRTGRRQASRGNSLCKWPDRSRCATNPSRLVGPRLSA